MCGICCIFYSKDRGVCYDEKFVHEHSRLNHRGPDRSCSQHVELCDGAQALFSGHVLHLRGATITPQPAQSAHKDLLLWNGEIFDGIKVGEDECDTQVLLDLLSDDQISDHKFLSTMAQIQGPWSFIFWQASSETLWFGRDVFGRRSLLWHLPESSQEVLALTSVRIQSLTFSEIPSIGLFKMTRCCEQGLLSYQIDVFPWQHAVWPGSLDPVYEDENFAERIYPGCVTAAVRFCVRGEDAVPSLMPRINKELPPADCLLPPLLPEQAHIDYLKVLLDTDSFWQVLAQQLTDVLLRAVKTRVFNQPRMTRHETAGIKDSFTHDASSDPQIGDTRQCTDDGSTLDLPNSNLQSDVTEKLTLNDRVTGNDGDKCEAATFDPTTPDPTSPDATTPDPTTPDPTTPDPTSLDPTTPDPMTDPDGSSDGHVISTADVAILFSGGIDSTVLAALADRCVPEGEPIDLLNVAFEMKQKQSGNTKRRVEPPAQGQWEVPDRLTGYTALSELNPNRQWNFIEVNITATELQEARHAHIRELLYPLTSVLDDSIGCAIWFAARGQGILGNGTNKGSPITSRARVLLCGMGADEQLAGYSRHRGRFQAEGWAGLINELELEVTRISARNLGRDDRIITDHGKESRFPFLDEKVVQFLSSLPVNQKADLRLPRGLGEKLLLRLCATQLGLPLTAALPKRAIQFGSRIAKLENTKEKASDTCTRLTNSATGHI